MSTTVFVKDTHTVLIGGLFNSSDSDSETKLPVLGSIPVIRVYFLVPKIIRPDRIGDRDFATDY